MREWHFRFKAGIGVVISKLLAKDFESEILSTMGGRDPPDSQVVFHQSREIHEVLPVVGKYAKSRLL